MLTSDNELIEQYLSGEDEDAFEQLIRRHSPMVWGVCRSLLWQSQDAEDAYQATFVLLATNASKLLKHNSVGGWLHETSVRTCLKLRRQIARIREVKMEYDPIQHNSEPWQIIASDRDRELLHREIMRLPDRYREFIVLCLLEGKSRGQAAAITQCPTTVVKAALAQGRKLLRRRLLKHGIGMSAILGLVGSTGSVKAATADSVSQLLEPLIESTLQVCLLSPHLATQSLSPVIRSLVQNNLIPFSTSSSSNAFVVSVTLFVVGGLFSACCWFAPKFSPEMIVVEFVPSSKFVEPLKTVSLEIASTVNPPEAIPKSNDFPLKQDRDYLETQSTALEHELTLMKEMVGLDAATIEKIRTAVRHDLEQAAMRCLDRELELSVIFVVPILEQEFEKALWRKAKDFIPESKAAEYELFVAGAKKLNVIFNENSQKSAAQFLSNLLSLTKDQELQIKAMLGENWESDWNVPAGYIGGNSVNMGRDVFDSLRLESVLTEKQQEVFNAIENFANFSTSPIVVDPRTPKWDPLLLKNRCSVLMDLRIDEIHQLCTLSPSQKRRLAIAKKGAISEVVSKWERALHARSEEEDNSQVSRMAVQCLTSQCTAQQTWTNAIKNTLDKDELQQWEARELARTQANRDGLINNMISAITADVSLSWEQHSKLVKMLEQHIETVGMNCVAEVTVHLPSIPDQKIADVLYDTQSNAVLESVRRRREWVEQFKLNSEEKADGGGES